MAITMKKIFASFLLVSLALSSFVACESEKDFLTEKPKAQFSIDNAYQTSAQVLSTVVAAYSNLAGVYYGKANAQQTDELTVFSVFGASGNIINNWNSTGSWSFGGMSGDSINAKQMWDMCYQVNAYANQALYASNLESMSWSSDAEKKAIQAEAKFLRGFVYLRLAELYGGVPLVLEYSEELHLDYERATRQQTYEQAIKDLLEAYNGLPESPVKGRAGKGAAAICLSEAYLGLAVETNNSSLYTDAAKYAQDCINLHKLMTKRFGVRANPEDKGSNLGVPNYIEEGTVYSDLFYKQNPRLDDNTEAVWLILGPASYSEASQNSSVIRTMSSRVYWPALRDVSKLKSDLQEGSGEKPWADGKFAPLYGQVNGRGTNIPAIIGSGVPFGGQPTWFSTVQAFDATRNKVADKDDRGKEGVAIRRYYPVTNAAHPYFSKQENERPYGTSTTWVGFEDLDKENFNTTMEFFPISDKRSPIDAWGMDENTYFSASVFGTALYRDWYMYRSAEAYLLLAEAKFRAGDASAAAAAINVLRDRANAEPFTAGEINLQVILDERCRELMYEEDRWATFLRQEPDLWKTRIWSYGAWSYSASKGTLNPNAKLYPETQQVDASHGGETVPELKWDLWPIPKAYVDLNTDNPEGMKQNSGWE